MFCGLIVHGCLKKMKKLNTLYCFAVTSTVYGQKTNGIAAFVIDSLTQKPVEFATVAYSPIYEQPSTVPL